MTITPFRYPGSKNKMLPILMEHLDPLIQTEQKFVDVFVGGGSVLLEVATKYPKIELYANDKDYWIACFWSVVSSGDSKKLSDLLELVQQPATLELFYKLRQELTTDEIQCAYRAIFFNRTTFSGILYSGPIGGKEQKSKYTVDCRYNVKKLCQKITQCFNLLSGRTTVSNKDFIAYDVLIDTNYPAYLDPPYYVKGNILYIEYMKPQEHNNLSELLCKRKNWVLSYDDCSEIRDLYKGRTIIDSTTRYCINGKKTSWESKNELIIL